LFTILFTILFAGSIEAQIAFDPATNITIGDMPDSVAIADFDGDGNADVAVTSDNQDKVSILFNTGTGSLGAPNHILLGAGVGVAAVVAGDLDGTNGIDLAVTLKNTSNVQVLLNNGSGTLTPGSTFGVGTEPAHMAIGYLDNNGSLDLVTSNRDSNNVSVLLNTGTGSFGASTSYAAGTDPRGVALGDFNSNGLLDIAVSSHDTREIHVLSNQGSGTFAAGTVLSVGAQLRPEGVIATDLDGNGTTDIAAATSGNTFNFASVFLRTGANSFSGPTNFATSGVNPSDLVAGDFDLDGDKDLALVNTDSNNLSVLPNNGAGSFGGASLFNVGTAPDHLAAADLDGNGSKEIVTVNKDSDNISVLMNQNTAWIDLGFGLAGTNGIPDLAGKGALEAGVQVSLELTSARANSQALFVAGLSRIDTPFMGGTFVPALDVFFILPTSPTGTLTLTVTWPDDIAPGADLYFQYWISDPAAVQNVAASNALETITQ
jgi:hypothetical protein